MKQKEDIEWNFGEKFPHAKNWDFLENSVLVSYSTTSDQIFSLSEIMRTATWHINNIWYIDAIYIDTNR